MCVVSQAPPLKNRGSGLMPTHVLFPPPESGGAYFVCIAYGVGVV